jgi:hypothetical protein
MLLAQIALEVNRFCISSLFISCCQLCFSGADHHISSVVHFLNNNVVDFVAVKEMLPSK